MTGPVTIDTNLLLLFVVGSANPGYIAAHKRLRTEFDADDLEILGMLIAQYSDIVLLPQVVVEVANLAGQIAGAACEEIRLALRQLVEETVEVPVASLAAVRRDEFRYLGVTDAAILHLLSLDLGASRTTLLTIDNQLAAEAEFLGHRVQNYRYL